jgi:hypothetical protein
MEETLGKNFVVTLQVESDRRDISSDPRLPLLNVAQIRSADCNALDVCKDNLCNGVEKAKVGDAPTRDRSGVEGNEEPENSKGSTACWNVISLARGILTGAEACFCKIDFWKEKTD